MLKSFCALILDLLCRAKNYVQSMKDVSDCYIQHQRFCIALSKVIAVAPEMKGQVLKHSDLDQTSFEMN